MYRTLYTVLVSFLTISVATGLTAAEYKGPNLSGQTVSIAGPWLTGEEENFDKVNAYFEKATGAKVDYAGSDSFEQQIVIDIKAGSPPNLAVFPQPGLAANMAAIGGLVPLGNDMENWVKKLCGRSILGGSWHLPGQERERLVLRIFIQRQRQVPGLVCPGKLRSRRL